MGVFRGISGHLTPVWGAWGLAFAEVQLVLDVVVPTGFREGNWSSFHGNIPGGVVLELQKVAGGCEVQQCPCPLPSDGFDQKSLLDIFLEAFSDALGAGDAEDRQVPDDACIFHEVIDSVVVGQLPHVARSGEIDEPAEYEGVLAHSDAPKTVDKIRGYFFNYRGINAWYIDAALDLYMGHYLPDRKSQHTFYRGIANEALSLETLSALCYEHLSKGDVGGLFYGVSSNPTP